MWLNKKLHTDYFNRHNRSILGHHNGTSPGICSLEPQNDREKSKNLPTIFNWADQGYVTPVRHQYSCGACYCFAATASMESQYMIKVRKDPLPSFSVQAVLNCMSGGCSGGVINNALKRFKDYGATLDAVAPYEYPYEVRDSLDLLFNSH